MKRTSNEPIKTIADARSAATTNEINRRGILRMASLLGASTAMVCALGLAVPTMARAQQETTVRMWTFLNPAGKSPREVALSKIIESYQAANPGIKIVVEIQAWDQMTPKFLAAHASGNAPDLIWVARDAIRDAIDSGSLTDLNELFISGWSPERVADYASPFWDLTKLDGKQYAIFALRTYVSIMYRTDFLSEAGIDPNSLTTWSAFRSAAEKLTVKDASGQVTRYGFAQSLSEQQPETSPIIPWMLGDGIEPFNSDGTANFANASGVEAMTFFSDLITKDGISPSQASTWAMDDLYEQFASGRLAMIVGSAIRMSTVQAKLGADKVGLMLWPGNGKMEHSPAVMDGWPVGVWSGSQVKKEAGDFLQYMTSPDGDKIWVTVGGQIPSLKSTRAELVDFIGQPEKQWLNVVAEGSTKYGWLSPVAFATTGYRQILNRAAQRIVVDGVAVESALKDAEADFNRQNNR